ncbi:hypothetical protein DEU56DRAFT_59759 [Suillus clintonianus]|uniref:uncharacterized protein n=1 Tax=Suillus clintonianus TaxID=1904413 RepID=UPI001B884650|nr:uncharacterized protein DEU56DRAFT_59759 [Suillus clintonianus]KAG2149320.1 hypothetical protein DEU56DRAFT_59759 [Suillus clintonianus]
MPAVERNETSVACTVCDKVISRKGDLPRHMRTHAEDKEALMHACPFPNCDHKTLQKSNMQTHIRTHTREFSKTCPHPGCAYATTDPGSLTHHRKALHGYEPKARCIPGGKAARRSAAAPYPSTQSMKSEAEIPESLDFAVLVSPKSQASSTNSPGRDSSPTSPPRASSPFMISPLSSPPPPLTTTSLRLSLPVLPLSRCRSLTRSCPPMSTISSPFQICQLN